MRAVRMVAVGRPLEMFELPVPEIGDREVLVRVRSAGICHSDVHYRAGKSPVRPLPLTLGHEVAGIVEAVGKATRRIKPGDRVVLNYMVTCGDCMYCNSGNEQFCTSGLMIGHYTNGGYADYIAVPERGVLGLPDEISFEQGATLMCASATSFHALRKARLQAGETLAVFGAGGLGMSAIQLGYILGAMQVFAVDVQPSKLQLAERYGAIPIDARQDNPSEQIRKKTGGRGVDVAIELIGIAETMQQALRSLAIQGRVVIVGIGDQPLSVNPYTELIGPEVEIIGSNDHLLQELPHLIELARCGRLDLSHVVSRKIPLDAVEINRTLDELEQGSSGVRTVIVP
jgi:2-desacetyl-2-hydroxyethyl bacteriochlorophyllide A dehydrogenase